MNSSSEKFLFFLAFETIMILFIVIIVLFKIVVPEAMLWNSENITKNNELQCDAQEQIECVNSDGCPGHRICVEGTWSECIVRRVCTPGDITGCFAGPCATGYAVCNACGTAYENCTPSG